MKPYEEMIEYVLDEGRECECCKCTGMCSGGVIMGPDGPIFPPCAEKDFSELLIPKFVKDIYKEAFPRD